MSKDLRKEYTEEIEQRSGFQWDIYKLNLITGGAIITFAVKDPGEFEYALLILPAFSFILFLYWFHHGIVIKIKDEKSKIIKSSSADDKKEKSEPTKFMSILRVISITGTILGNFIGFPFLAIMLFFKTQKTQGDWFLILDLVLLSLIVILFGLWVIKQYDLDKTSKNIWRKLNIFSPVKRK